MSIIYNNSNISAIYYQDNSISKAYCGNDLVWPEEKKTITGWHPTELTASDFSVFYTTYKNSDAHDGAFCAKSGTPTWGSRNAGATFVLPNSKVPYSETISSTKVNTDGYGTYDFTDCQSDVDKNVENNYSRILVPKGCKTISLYHTCSNWRISLWLPDFYYENEGNALADGGYVLANQESTIDVSNYNQGESRDLKYYITSTIRTTNDDDITDLENTFAHSSLVITFNY